MITKEFILYGSDGCHLCEQALAICLTVLTHEQLSEIDIVDQPNVAHETKTLVELYGVHIPVLEKLDDKPCENKKLFWPFTAEQVAQLNRINKKRV
ncbi:MAG: glutaredoxin family protein [Colwellia sp.]|nr:glutaredoxin family protein [Colwellia sp.]